MKKNLLFLSSFFISLTILAQSGYKISGKIIDEATKLPLEGASVFAENTTIGTATNERGEFRLTLPDGGYTIVVTYSGYQRETKRVTAADTEKNEMLFEVKKNEKSMEEFVVKSSSEVADGLEKYGEFFLDNFIGKTANARQCSVKNKEVLKFYYYRRSKRLKILATAPLEIVNNALGYTIKYALDSFVHEYNTQVSLFTGYPLFQEMLSTDTAQIQQWNSARKIAYQGSMLHFMRSVHEKKLKEAGFEIQFLVKNNEKENAIPIKNFYGALNYELEDSTGTVSILPLQKKLAVIYKNESPSDLYLANNSEASPQFQLSTLTFMPDEALIIEQNGYYFEQNNLVINDYWAWEKVADMLPYDYDFKEHSITAERKPNAEIAADSSNRLASKESIGNNPLFNVTWKMEESRVIEGNQVYYYKRNGADNSINFDNDFYTFNADNTGIYAYNGQDYRFSWRYLNTEKNKMELIMQYPTPLYVTLENMVLTPTSLTYTRLQKQNGINYMAIETRVIR